MPASRILVVEDETAYAKILSRNLEKLGYTVTGIANTGEQAIQLAGETRPDLVLLDLVLPGKLTGIDAAMQIRDRFDIPFVYMSAAADLEWADQLKATHPVGYLTKFADKRNLYFTLEIALETARKRKELRQSEQALKESERCQRQLAQENAELVKEVNHRVGNNLQLLLGLVDWAADGADLPETRQVLQALQGRIESMASVHHMLNESRWAAVDLCQLIHSLVRDVLAAGSPHQHIELGIDFPADPVYIEPKPAFKLSLVMNELATNSLKHAFSHRDTGNVSVSVVVDGPWIEILFADDGPGWPPDVIEGQRRSIGLSLVHSVIVNGLNGSIAMSNQGGAVIKMRFNREAS